MFWLALAALLCLVVWVVTDQLDRRDRWRHRAGGFVAPRHLRILDRPLVDWERDQWA